MCLYNVVQVCSSVFKNSRDNLVGKASYGMLTVSDAMDVGDACLGLQTCFANYSSRKEFRILHFMMQTSNSS